MTVRELRKILKRLPPEAEIDEFRIYGEDFDLCDEMRRRGGRDSYLEGVPIKVPGFRDHC